VSGEPYFLVDDVPPSGSFLLTGPEGRHAATVRRLRAGESLVLTDGRGMRAAATVIETGRGELTVEVGSAEQVPAPKVRVDLVQALPKGERGELAVELATEAGVDAVIPWAAQRCIAHWKTAEQRARGVEKWRNTAREAAKQSRRPYVPPVAELTSSATVVDLIGAATSTLILHESATGSLAQARLPESGNVVLIVGPEGGLTEDELTMFRTAGAVAVRLGPQVLRTSTAGAVALGALGVLTGRWS
jgi:16S rRNA (uracil1498-N3)-methyltransferase